MFLSLSTHLVRLTERKNPDNHSIIRVYWYPDPGENPQSIKENILQGNGIEVRGHGNRATIYTDTDTHVTVYSVNGTTITNMNVKGGVTLIDNLNSGIYILKATDKNGKTTTKKFIVQ